MTAQRALIHSTLSTRFDRAHKTHMFILPIYQQCFNNIIYYMVSNKQCFCHLRNYILPTIGSVFGLSLQVISFLSSAVFLRPFQILSSSVSYSNGPSEQNTWQIHLISFIFQLTGCFVNHKSLLMPHAS